MDIMEDVVESFARKLLISSGNGGMDSEALQEWLLKSREDSKKLCTSIEIFIDCLANHSLPWAAYHAFMSGHLIAHNNQPGVRPVSVRETWRCLFTKLSLKVMGPESANACQDNHL